jgi:hypothetical protein
MQLGARQAQTPVTARDTRSPPATETPSLGAHAFVRNLPYLVTSSTDCLVKASALRKPHHLAHVAIVVANPAPTSANPAPTQRQVALAAPLPHACLGPALPSCRGSALPAIVDAPAAHIYR